MDYWLTLGGFVVIAILLVEMGGRVGCIWQAKLVERQQTDASLLAVAEGKRLYPWNVSWFYPPPSDLKPLTGIDAGGRLIWLDMAYSVIRKHNEKRAEIQLALDAVRAFKEEWEVPNPWPEMTDYAA